MASSGFYRVVHFSDLHLTADDETPRTEPRLFGRLTGMNAAFRRLVGVPVIQAADRILVTGDVTDRGEPGAWQVFWDTLRQAKLADRVIVLPGNHDVCCLGMRLPNPQSVQADQEKAAAGLRQGGQPHRFAWAVQPTPQLVIFGLNSCNLGNDTAATNARGWLGHHQLAGFASLLYQHREVPVKIVALHHSPNMPESQTAERRGQQVLIKRLLLPAAFLLGNRRRSALRDSGTARCATVSALRRSLLHLRLTRRRCRRIPKGRHHALLLHRRCR